MKINARGYLPKMLSSRMYRVTDSSRDAISALGGVRLIFCFVFASVFLVAVPVPVCLPVAYCTLSPPEWHAVAGVDGRGGPGLHPACRYRGGTYVFGNCRCRCVLLMLLLVGGGIVSSFPHPKSRE